MAEPTPQAAPSRTPRAWLHKLGTSRRDLVLLGSLASLAPLAWCLPQRLWDPVCHGLAQAQPWRWPSEGARDYRYVRVLGAQPPGLTPAACVRRRWAHVYRERLHVLRSHLTRQPLLRPRLEGREHLEAAVAARRGVILWIAPFVYCELPTMIALRATGYEGSLLSRSAHSFSATPLGERLLNPIRTRVEDRYLAERLVISPENPIAALRSLIQRLRARQTVVIGAIAWADQLYRLPFLNGSIPLAGGPPALAVRSGATLLPVFTGREGASEWVTVIEPPLRAPLSDTRDQAVSRLLLQYTALLESYVIRWPDQFRPRSVRFEPD